MQKDIPNKMMQSEDKQIKTKEIETTKAVEVSGGAYLYPDYGVTANSLEEAIEKFNKLQNN
jgi:hypothetical protein